MAEIVRDSILRGMNLFLNEVGTGETPRAPGAAIALARLMLNNLGSKA